MKDENKIHGIDSTFFRSVHGKIRWGIIKNQFFKEKKLEFKINYYSGLAM
jgi:hypothetical protein